MVLPNTGLMFWVGKLMKSVKSMKDAAVQVTAVRILRQKYQNLLANTIIKMSNLPISLPTRAFWPGSGVINRQYFILVLIKLLRLRRSRTHRKLNVVFHFN